MSPHEHPDPSQEPPASLRALLGRVRASPWTRRAELVLTLALLAWVLVRLGPQLSAWTGVGPAVGQAPDFQVRTLDGALLKGTDLRGRVVVVNFWATWCAPCRLEMPALQKLHESHQGEGLTVLGLATDVGGATVVRRFLRERNVTFPVALADTPTRRAFGGIPGIPTTFIVDRNGVIRHRVVGLFAPPALGAAVRRLLEEEPSDGSQPSR